MNRTGLKRLSRAIAALTLVVAAAGLLFSMTGDVTAQEGVHPPVRSFAHPAFRPSAFQPDAPETLSAPADLPVLRPSQPVGIVDAPSAAAAVSQPTPGVASAPAKALGTAVPSTRERPIWPTTLPDTLDHAKATLKEGAIDAFTPQDIASAKLRCSALLKGLDVVVLEEAPIKSGACGTPAPVQLISLGRNPQVTLSPPVTMTCEMVAGLHQWLTQDLQPLAKKHLASPIIGIETMSSYSCRNAYGRKRGNLSEHGRANALDIRGFRTADAKETDVLADWGHTGWEIRTQVAAAAKAAADKVAAEKSALAKAAVASANKAPAAAATPAQAAITPQQPAVKIPSIAAVIDAVPAGLANRLPGAAAAAESQGGYGLMRPSQLGGPKSQPVKTSALPDPAAPAKPTVIDAASQSRKAQFLRAAHSSACRVFGTTLGPETNLAHKNHLHVDMAERPTGKNYCE